MQVYGAVLRTYTNIEIPNLDLADSNTTHHRVLVLAPITNSSPQCAACRNSRGQPPPPPTPSSLLRRLSRIRIQPNHKIILIISNLDLPSPSISVIVPSPLAKTTRQHLIRLRADLLRQRRRSSSVIKPAKARDEVSPCRVRRPRALVDVPHRLCLGHAGEIEEEVGAGGFGLGSDRGADAPFAGLLAGVGGRLLGDAADVGETADISGGAGAGGESVFRRCCVVSGGDLAGGDRGVAAAV